MLTQGLLEPSVALQNFTAVRSYFLRIGIRCENRVYTSRGQFAIPPSALDQPDRIPPDSYAGTERHYCERDRGKLAADTVDIGVA